MGFGFPEGLSEGEIDHLKIKRPVEDFWGQKCQRCYRYKQDAGFFRGLPGVCLRCAIVLCQRIWIEENRNEESWKEELLTRAYLSEPRAEGERNANN